MINFIANFFNERYKRKLEKDPDPVQSVPSAAHQTVQSRPTKRVVRPIDNYEVPDVPDKIQNSIN